MAKDAAEKKSKKKGGSREVEFEFERDTKTTRRFMEVTDEEPVVGTIYVKKSLFGGEGSLPDGITLTIGWGG